MSTVMVKDSKFASYATLLLRMGLGIGFLSAVADRLGMWGAFGQPNVEWGDFSRFLEYTHLLNWYLPAGMTLPLGVIATGAEILLGLLLLVLTGIGGSLLLTNCESFPFSVDEFLSRRTIHRPSEHDQK